MIRRMSPRRLPIGTLLTILMTLLLLTVFASLLWGAVPLSPQQLFDSLMSSRPTSLEHVLVWQLRLPRTLLAVLVGMQMATAGLILQAVIRNPLADPGVIGISGGAGLAVISILLVADLVTANQLVGGERPDMMIWLPAMALFGGLSAASLVLCMSWKARLTPLHLTLNGVALSAMLNALIMWVIVTQGGSRTEIALIWLSGSLYGRDILHFQVLWPWSLLGLSGALLLLKPMSLLQLDETVATSLGVRVRPWRFAAIGVAVVLSASAVAVAGPLGFIGLVTPHLARQIVGADPLRLMASTMLIGSILTLSADLVGRTLINPQEIPVGALTTLLGIPVFLMLLYRQARFQT